MATLLCEAAEVAKLSSMMGAGAMAIGNASDNHCACNCLQVTTLLSKAKEVAESAPVVTPEQLAALKAETEAAGNAVKEAKAAAAADKANSELAAQVRCSSVPR